jgi:hypothetical protein
MTEEQLTRDLCDAWRVLNIAIFVVLLVGVAALLAWGLSLRMPGRSGRPRQAYQRRPDVTARLREDVQTLAGVIGERNVFLPERLQAAEQWLTVALREAGYEVRREPYETDGVTVANLIAEIAGSDRASEIVLVGAHYDTVSGTPGADDNASGVAATLALARSLRTAVPRRTIRFVFFVNEEPPWFQTAQMGSHVHARGARSRGEKIVAMFSIECVGFYSDGKTSQMYPVPVSLVYPAQGNFAAFVGNIHSAALVREAIEIFRGKSSLPSEGGALPEGITGIGWSDQWSFWRFGYPAVMVTDTALFRNPYYHSPGDTPETLDYERMEELVGGMEAVVATLAGVEGNGKRETRNA